MNSPPELQCLSNGQFEIVVSPAIGRIVSYGPVHGPNVLWEHPGAAEAPTPFRGWINWGGDKVWLWPEQNWGDWNGGRHAPPGDPTPVPYDIQIDGRLLRMVSPVLPGCGVRIVNSPSPAAALLHSSSVNLLDCAS